MLYLILIVECFAMWPFPHPHDMYLWLDLWKRIKMMMMMITRCRCASEHTSSFHHLVVRYSLYCNVTQHRLVVFLPMIWDSVSVPSSRAKIYFDLWRMDWNTVPKHGLAIIHRRHASSPKSKHLHILLP